RPGDGGEDPADPDPGSAGAAVRAAPAATRPRRGRQVTALVVVAAGLLLSAFFSAAEMAFIAANRIRLRHMAEQGSRVARGYMDAFQQPERLLSTAMMGVTIATSAPRP